MPAVATPSEGAAEAPTPAVPSTSPDAALAADFLNRSSRFSPYEYVADVLRTLANPHANGGYDVSFDRRQLNYRLVQRSPQAPIELVVSRKVAPNSKASPETVLHLTYFPNGEFHSSKINDLHPALAGAELLHHTQLQDIIQTDDTAKRTYRSLQIYKGLRTALEGLKPRYSPETQSAWYDHFAVHKGRIYSFRINHLLGTELTQDPRLKTIDVFEETEAGRRQILSLTASGENVTDRNISPPPPLKEPLNHELIALMEGVSRPLEEAPQKPESYQTLLGHRLGKIPWARNIPTPNIVHPVKIDASIANRSGGQGEPILEISKGWDLLRNIRPGVSHRWENPNIPGEVRYLKPRARLKVRMFREWLYWAFHSAKSGIADLSNPSEMKGRMSLQLFPDGGGQLNIYRFNPATQRSELHDVVIGEQRGPHWRAGREVDALKKSGASFPSRMAELQTALANRNHPMGLQLQYAPHIDLDRILLDPSLRSSAVTMGDAPYRSGVVDNPHTLNAQATWELIAKSLPPGANPQVRFLTPDHLLQAILPTPGEVNRVEAHFNGTEPHLSIVVQQHDIPEGDHTVRRMEIVMRRGDDIHARVFQDGNHRIELTRDISQSILRQARQGRVPRSSFILAAQAVPRLYTFYKNNGNAYVASYFASLPLVLGFEYLLYSPGEWKLLHSKIPSLRRPVALAKDILGSFTLVTTASGLGSVMVDGAYNLAPGLRSCWQAWRSGANFFQAYGNIRPTFYNRSTLVRPLGGNVVRGFFQRAVPLSMGVAAMDFLHTKRLMSPMFWPNMINVGAVSAASSLMLRGVYSSPRLSGIAIRAGLMEAATQGGVSRFSLRLKGSLLVAGLEMLALGVLSAYERRDMLREAEDHLRSELGNSLTAHNELLTLLGQGEDIRPSEFAEATQSLQYARALYRRFLELDERNQGTRHYQALAFDNDFSDEYFRFEASQSEPNFPGEGRIAPIVGNLEFEHRQRLVALRAQRAEQKEKLKDIYRRHGIKIDGEAPREAGWRELIAAQLQGDAAKKAKAPVASPLAIDSPCAKDIFEYLRWKASEDPQFLFLDPKEKARAILKQFSLWTRTPDGGSRRWSTQEAMAFLREAKIADEEAMANMKPSLLLPSEAEQMRSETIDKILKEQAQLHAESTAFNRHGASIARSLARNIPDFDRQMEEYLQESNARMAAVLEKRFVDPELLARLQSGAKDIATPATP